MVDTTMLPTQEQSYNPAVSATYLRALAIILDSAILCRCEERHECMGDKF